MFDLVEPEAAPASISLPSGTAITKVVWSRADPQRLLTGSNDGRIRAWDLRTEQEVQSAAVDGASLLIPCATTAAATPLLFSLFFPRTGGLTPLILRPRGAPPTQTIVHQVR